VQKKKKKKKKEKRKMQLTKRLLNSSRSAKLFYICWIVLKSDKN